ncbi:MAG: flagellar hook-basal body complex protein [Planctomycetes bacterium]|nr:flagellar hook-basal body complex protein [Planctomycetota bacterium]
MGASLLAGVSGLRNHQKLLDVVANNLANINTPGFKVSNVGFADLFSQTLDTGAASSTNLGGRNPVQLGMGVKTAGISTNFEQGSLSATGRTLDVAIEGDGFFVLSDGNQNYYTRVGQFDVDSSNMLVLLGAGYRVMDAGGAQITIPKNVTMPGQITTNIDIVGNLDANADGPLAEVMTTNATFTTDKAIIAGTAAGPFALADGNSMTIAANANPAQTFTFLTADFVDIANATVTEVAAVINATAVGFSASDRDGRLVLESGSSDVAKSALLVSNASGTPAAALGLSTTNTTVVAAAATELQDLASNVSAYADGDVINITGTDYDGTTVVSTFTFGSGNDGITLGDLVTTISSSFTGATAALDSSGNLTLTADVVGDTNLFLGIADAAGTTGGTQFSNHSFDTTTQGGLGATRATSIKIYDSMGGSHVVSLIFRKEATNEWSTTASINAADGILLDSKIEGIRFGEDGSFSQVVGTGEGDPGFEMRFNGIASPQTIQLDLGTSGGFSGLTQYGSPFSAAAIGQDGLGPGSLRSISISADGTIQGNFSNGKISDIAQLQVATFSNPPGLLKQGDNLYLPGANSGPAVSGTAMAGGAGRISSSTIESSNVDIALEFTRLITAQRGFQVNARTITTTDQMMQELANLIR